MFICFLKPLEKTRLYIFLKIHHVTYSWFKPWVCWVVSLEKRTTLTRLLVNGKLTRTLEEQANPSAFLYPRAVLPLPRPQAPAAPQCQASLKLSMRTATLWTTKEVADPCSDEPNVLNRLAPISSAETPSVEKGEKHDRALSFPSPQPLRAYF